MEQRIFHADDWGMSPAINEGILELARRRRLRSASCMANAPFLAHRVEELLQFDVKIYLHLDLTYGQPLTGGTFYSHKRLLLRSVLGLINSVEVRREATAQLDALLELGLPVEGLNGHHHVHLLPGIAAPVQELMLERGIKKFLLLNDRSHWPSYLQTLIFRCAGLLTPGIEEVRCNYLRPRDLRTRARFYRKVRHGMLPLLIHPALYNDFVESGMTDSLQEQRVHDLRNIVEYLNA